MKPHDIFGVIVRTIGLLLMLSGSYAGFRLLLLLTSPPISNPPYGRAELLPGVVATIAVGIFCYMWADVVVRIAYPEEFRQS